MVTEKPPVGPTVEPAGGEVNEDRFGERLCDWEAQVVTALQSLEENDEFGWIGWTKGTEEGVQFGQRGG